MAWATLKIDGTFEKHEGVPKLEEMQAVVGGYVEVVELEHGVDMWLNEEGKYIWGEPTPTDKWNHRATMFAHAAKSIQANDWIAGDVLFTGGADDDGDTVGLSDEQMAYVESHAPQDGEARLVGVANAEADRLGIASA
jgi:hypothetical protein